MNIGKNNVILDVCIIVFSSENEMESAGDGSSNAPGNGEIDQPEGHGNPPVMTSAERIEATMAQFLGNQAAYMQWQTMQQAGSSSISIMDHFRRLCSAEFHGAASPVDAEKWLHEIERAFSTLGVPEHQKVNLASYNLKGEALYWWEAYDRQISMPVLGDVVAIPRIVTWNLFVKGFNEQYCPAAYRMEQQNAFLYLKQG